MVTPAPGPSEVAPPAFTLGVEEEFHVIAPDSGRGTNDSDRVLQRLPSDGGHYTGELLETMVETCTPVCPDLTAVRRELQRTRRKVVEAARAAGRRVVAAGTVPFTEPDPQISDGQRYDDILELHQLVALEQSVCGCHVHVGISDREVAMQVANRVSPWLPVLLALSANSPYHDGVDTGFASYRTVVWTRWPSATPWPGFARTEDYERTVGDLLRTGVITDRGQIYWDLRLSEDNPTLEFRTADTFLSIDETVLHAALCRALARTAWNELTEGRPHRSVGVELRHAARWKAARFGLSDELVDVFTPASRPAREVVDQLLTHIDAALSTDDCRDEVHGLVDAVFARGTAAQRQRRVRADGGDLRDVVAMLVEETAAGLGPGLVAEPA